MLPVYERLNAPKAVFRIPFVKVAMAVVSLPLCSFVFCVVWSLLFEFERATSTHCDVPNFLPSISAAIGNYEPQKTVWRLAIVLHMPARIAVAKMYLQYYRDTIHRNRRGLATLACVLNVCEDFALLSLSLWSSSDNYTIHRNSFIVFIVCSQFYMLISFCLNKYGRRIMLLPIEEISLNYKRNICIVNVISFCLAGYCFMRHNARCEPGAYSIFAYFEYFTCLALYTYDALAVIDLRHFYIVFTDEKGLHFIHEQVLPQKAAVLDI